MGKIRRNNEDNYYVDGIYRKDVTLTEDESFSGTLYSDNNEMAAVFDGMGGEACGEVASLVAARTCFDFSSRRKEFEEYLYELSDMINNEVLRETDIRSLVLMGTTGCMIQFGDDAVYVLNVGDSRIYKYSKGEFKQISVDHVARGFSSKAPLIKFFGLPVDKKPLGPYIAMGSYEEGDMYVLCTDGITDMISDEEIRKELDNAENVSVCAKRLVQTALANGGIDNATVIVCKVTGVRNVK